MHPRRRLPTRLLAPSGAALVVGLLIVASSASARAQPRDPGLPAPLPAPPLPPIQSEAPPGQYPTYLYLPDAPPPPPPPPQLTLAPPRKRTWYGWQTLLVYGSSAVAGALVGSVGIATQSSGLAALGIGAGSGGLALGGPIVHWYHGNIAKGFGALGLNFGMPLVGLGLGVGTTCVVGGCGGHDELGNMLVGAIIGASAGLLGSFILDATVLAYSYEPVAPGPPTTARRAPSWTIVPDLEFTHEKTTFGFAGVF